MKTRHQFVLTDEYIADAQRVAIAQNKTFKFIYQTWWVWWLPRVVMGGMLIFLLSMHLNSSALLFGVFLLLTFWGEWFNRRGLAKARKRVRTRGSTTVISMNEEGVDIESALSTSHLKWTAIVRAAHYPQGVYIKLSNLTGYWLPDEALTEGSPADVRQLVAEHVSGRS